MSDALTPFVPQNIDQATKLAETLARSTLLPEPLRGKPGDVLVTLITGHELGLSPMQAIRGLYVVKGKAVMSADLTVALVKKRPECLFFRLVESTDARATYETHRKGDPKPTAMTFTIEQAQRARLAGDNWQKYPAAMLRARCSSALARAVYPDLALGVYDPDEAKDFGAADQPELPPQPDEREVNPPPEPAKQTRTEEVKGELRNALAAKNAKEPEPPKLSPRERIFELCKQAGLDKKRMASVVMGATGKAAKAPLVEADVALVQAALAQIRGEPPPDVPLPGDKDAPPPDAMTEGSLF